MAVLLPATRPDVMPLNRWLASISKSPSTPGRRPATTNLAQRRERRRLRWVVCGDSHLSVPASCPRWLLLNFELHLPQDCIHLLLLDKSDGCRILLASYPAQSCLPRPSYPANIVQVDSFGQGATSSARAKDGLQIDVCEHRRPPQRSSIARP